MTATHPTDSTDPTNPRDAGQPGAAGAAAGRLDLVTVGRVSVDLYPRESGVGLDAQQSFVKSVGGSPTNVAVGAARLGLRVAPLTAVGDDGFGRYVLARLAGHGLDLRFVHRRPGGRTPLAVVALDPPQTPTVAFYRDEAAPDACLPAELVAAALAAPARALWLSHAALVPGPTADALLERLPDRDAADAARPLTLLDLDHRPALWAEAGLARERAGRAIAVSDVVVGNLAEAGVALGTADPDRAADELLARGVRLAVVKLGPDGVLLAVADRRVRIGAPVVDVVCGLGAGDAFGASLVHGLLAGAGPERADLEEVGRNACAAGAFVTARLTCSDDMPTRDDVAAMRAGR